MNVESQPLPNPKAAIMRVESQFYSLSRKGVEMGLLAWA